jgi:hypothetical protein
MWPDGEGVLPTMSRGLDVVATSAMREVEYIFAGWRAVRVGALQWWLPRWALLRAQSRALWRWLTLSARSKDQNTISELASVQGFLSATPLAPYRLFVIALSVVAAWGAFGWWQKGQAENQRDAACNEQDLRRSKRVSCQQVAQERGARQAAELRAAIAEQAARDANDRIAGSQTKVVEEMQGAAERRQKRTAIERRAAEQARRVRDAKPQDNGGAQPFDGERWMRERAARGEAGSDAATGADRPDENGDPGA